MVEAVGKQSSSQQKKAFETYKKLQTLGTGSFGTAYLVECQSNTEKAVIKQIDIQAMSEDERKETLREAKILEVLNHPNIVRFREVYKTKKGKLCIVMDYADGGDLQSRIKEKHKKKQQTGVMEHFSEDQVLSWFTQICLALKHCHDRKILHRDLKSQNIFLTKKNIVKLGDFGIARVLSNTGSKAKTVVGTPYYLSPEIIESSPYSFKSDVWSLGVLLFEMCALQPPFNATSLHQLAQRILAGKFDALPRQYSASMSNLLKACLTKEPARRPTINQILKMPFIQSRINQFLGDQDFKDEFSHTLLHNKDVFKEFTRRMEEDKKKRAEEEIRRKQEEEKQRQQEVQNHILENLKRQREEEEVKRQMENLYINQYKAPDEYYSQFKDQEFFNYQYMNYVNQISNDIDAVNNNDQPYSLQPLNKDAQSVASSDKDRDDQDYHDAYSENNSANQQDEMINLYTCDFSGFAAHMSKQYGEQQFNEGFAIITKYKEYIYSEEGEEALVQKLKHLFANEELIRGFLNFCTSYIIVQNYSNNISRQ